MLPIRRLCSFYPVPNCKLGGRLASILRVSQWKREVRVDVFPHKIPMSNHRIPSVFLWIFKYAFLWNKCTYSTQFLGFLNPMVYWCSARILVNSNKQRRRKLSAFTKQLHCAVTDSWVTGSQPNDWAVPPQLILMLKILLAPCHRKR